jgi:DNA-binding transcriptional LysR family regulator
MNINLKLLYAFLLIAENKSFRGAAEKANRSQAAISMQIKQLEEQLGVQLFVRTTRRVEITPEGEFLLSHARKSLDELDHGLTQIREAARSRSRKIKFSCIPSVASAHLPSIILKFQKTYPNVTLHVSEMSTPELLQHGREIDVDFAIAPHIESAKDFYFDHVTTEPICAIVPRHLGLSDRTSLRLAELTDLPIMSLTGTTDVGLNQTMRKALESQSLSLKAQYEFQRTSTLIEMAAAGIGVAILPRMALRLAGNRDVQFLPIVDPVITRDIGIITLRGRTLSPMASRMVTIVKEVLRENT